MLCHTIRGLKTMNYRKDFEKCFDYIDYNLKNDISIQGLADYLGYSIFHFCRIFHLYTTNMND